MNYIPIPGKKAGLDVNMQSHPLQSGYEATTAQNNFSYEHTRPHDLKGVKCTDPNPVCGLIIISLVFPPVSFRFQLTGVWELAIRSDGKLGGV